MSHCADAAAVYPEATRKRSRRRACLSIALPTDADVMVAVRGGPAQAVTVFARERADLRVLTAILDAHTLPASPRPVVEVIDNQATKITLRSAEENGALSENLTLIDYGRRGRECRRSCRSDVGEALLLRGRDGRGMAAALLPIPRRPISGG